MTHRVEYIIYKFGETTIRSLFNLPNIRPEDYDESKFQSLVFKWTDKDDIQTSENLSNMSENMIYVWRIISAESKEEHLLLKKLGKNNYAINPDWDS